jgi:multiple sugar transport system permease protein
LSWIIFNDLRGEDALQLFGSAAATSMLTIIGVGILLIPVLISIWKEFNSKTV